MIVLGIAITKPIAEAVPVARCWATEKAFINGIDKAPPPIPTIAEIDPIIKPIKELTEILADYVNKAPGKELTDVLRGIAYTDKEGDTFFQFKSFWRYLLKTKSHYITQTNLKLLN